MFKILSEHNLRISIKRFLFNQKNSIGDSHIISYLQNWQVPYREKEIEKKYYTIGEVAEDLGVATSLIRFWEGEFDIIKPKKNRKGNRQFTKEDVKNVKLIYHLVKEKGYTLQGAREFIKSDVNAALDKVEMIESLKRLRGFLVDIRDQL